MSIFCCVAEAEPFPSFPAGIWTLNSSALSQRSLLPVFASTHVHVAARVFKKAQTRDTIVHTVQSLCLLGGGGFLFSLTDIVYWRWFPLHCRTTWAVTRLLSLDSIVIVLNDYSSKCVYLLPNPKQSYCCVQILVNCDQSLIHSGMLK